MNIYQKSRIPDHLQQYFEPAELGLEKTPEKYVEKMVEIFSEVKRVLKDDGTIWLNLGDSYASGGRGRNERNDSFLGNGTGAAQSLGRKKAPPGLKDKDLCGIPWRVAFALQLDGWYLRSDIIWHKPNPMPESVTDRPTKAHEYIFLLTKSQKYYYDHEATKEPVAESTVARGPVDFGGAKGHGYKNNIKPNDPNFRNGNEQWGRTFDYRESCKTGRNKRSVWTVATKPYKEAHFATYPEKLIEPCVLAGTKESDIILDPFFGAGTTGVVACKYDRKFIGIELNQEYCEIAKQRIAREIQQTKMF